MKILKEDYKLNKKAYNFIQKNRVLLDNCNFDEFFSKLYDKTEGDDFYSPLCHLIYNKFPDCLKYMTYIPYCFFASDKTLTSIEIPNNIKNIEEYAFQDCTNLTTIKLPNSVLGISEGAFDNCSSLTSIEIPNSVTSIGSWAFYKCSSLKNITIGNGLKSIGSGIFEACSPLKKVNYLGTKWRWKSIKKYSDWNEGPKIKEIQCTDGVLEYKR